MENTDAIFQSPGDRNIEQKTYLEPMNESLRSEAIDTCSCFNEAVPEAVAMGGMALRFQYEAKTGQPMFGAGKATTTFTYLWISFKIWAMRRQRVTESKDQKNLCHQEKR